MASAGGVCLLVVQFLHQVEPSLSSKWVVFQENSVHEHEWGTRNASRNSVLPHGSGSHFRIVGVCVGEDVSKRLGVDVQALSSQVNPQGDQLILGLSSGSKHDFLLLKAEVHVVNEAAFGSLIALINEVRDEL